MAEVDFSQLSQEELDALLDGPAGPPPEGEVSNFVDPPNSNGLAIGVITACTAVVVICLAIRLYAKLIIMRRAQVQEYLIVAAFACYIGWTYSTASLVPSPGYFVHTWNITLRQTVPMGYLIHLAGVFYTACLPLLKVSILLEWLGMFVSKGTRNWFFWASWIMIGLQVAFGVAVVIALNLACIPTKKKWEFWVPGKCINAHDIETASAAFQLASDCFVLFIPQKIIWSLQMGWRKRLGVSVIFSLGVLACVAAAFRLYVTVQYAETVDTVYHVGPVCFWAFAEMSCGFVVVCIPCVPKILLESGAWRKLKRSLGMSVTAGATGATPKIQTVSSSGMRSKNMRSANDSYLEIHDTEMKNLGASESAEHLRSPYANNPGHGIVRTTQVMVSHDSDMSNNEAMHDQRLHHWR